MSVRFVIGRAGSGKTAHCIEQITSRLRESAVEGEHLFLLVPEQAGMQMERALLRIRGIDGFARCEVVSFRRMAQRVLTASGGGTRTLSEIGRLMVLRRLIAEHADALGAFGASRGRRGLVSRLSRTIDELIREEVSPNDLAEACRRIEPNDDLLAARLRDIQTVYRAYLDALGDELCDPGHHLAVVRDRLPAYRPLTGSLVWVDGFAGLTRQEHLLLVSLAGLVQHMDISLLIDPDSPVIRDEAAVESFHLFARTEETYVRLRRALHAAGIRVEPPLLLRSCERRFKSSPELARLERQLFALPSRERASAGGAHPAPSAVRLIRAATRRVEIAAAVVEIQRLVGHIDRPMRYRDIAIIVRDLEPYHDLLSAALSAAGIPHFIDRRRPIAHHALVEWVRSAVALLDRVDVESVSAFTKTGLTGLDDDQADLLETFLRAQGIAGREQWLKGDWTCRARPSRAAGEDELTEVQLQDLRQANEARRNLILALTPWWQLPDSPTPPTARQWAAGLSDLLARLDVAHLISEWAGRADRAGRVEEAEEHRQVWTNVIGLLDDLAETFGDEPMSVALLGEVIDTALSDLTLALAPPTLDQVLIGSIERSRHPQIRAALVLGFGEGMFPWRPAEDPILSDRNREDLAAAGIELTPTSRQQLFDERLLAYIALTRPSEWLWISWPAADEDGRVLRPSPFVEAIRGIFPGLTITEWADSSTTRHTWAISSVEDLTAGLATDIRMRNSRIRADTGDVAADRRWNELYEWARGHDACRERLRRALASLVYRNHAGLSARSVASLYGDTLRLSVSNVERFAACPFQHFAAHILGLEPLAGWELEAIDLGLVYHRVLEAYVRRLIADGRRLSDVDPKSLEPAVLALLQEALSELVDETLLADARNAYLLDRGKQDLERTLRVQRFVASVGTSRPSAVEVAFGCEPSPHGHDASASGHLALPALQITTPSGRTVLLRGRIDRVDLAELGDRVLTTVVDYKRSVGRCLSLDRVFHGLDLQLMAYLLVLKDHGHHIANRPVEPAGAFYASLLDDVRALHAPPDKPPEEADRYRPLRPRGVFDWSILPALDSQASNQTPSHALAVEIKKDGTPGYVNRTDVAEHAAFVAILDCARRRIGELCDQMLNGNISVAPYRLADEMPCALCLYHDVCRYEFDARSARTMKRLDRKQVLDIVSGRDPEATHGN